MSLPTEDFAKKLLGDVLSRVGSGQAEAILSGGSCTVLRFANNRFHQNVRENRLQVYLRMVDGKKTTAVTTDDFSDVSLTHLVDRAKQSLRFVADDPNILPLLGAQSFAISPGRFDPQVGEGDLGEHMDAFGSFFGRCEDEKFEAAGKLELTEGTIGDYGELSPLAMANTRGLFVYSPATYIDFSTTVYRGNCSGWAGNSGRSWKYIDVKGYCERALQKARASLSPTKLSAGKYPVILEPAALRSLLAHVGDAFNAQNVVEGRSPLLDQVGKKVFPDWFQVTDDAYRDEIGGAPFDAEGVPVQKVELVSKGTVKGFVNTRALAEKMGVKPTGHGTFVPNPYGAFPRNFCLDGGTASLESMIQNTERAILVTRIWYTTPVDEKQMIISGMTRDGTFLVENGRISKSLTNLRFNEPLISMFQRVEEVGRPELSFSAMVPPVRIRDFNFTSSTEF